MKLQREKAIVDVIDSINEFSLNELIGLWNDIFPHEEKISKKTFKEKTSKEVEMLSDELIMIVIDEISSYDNDDLAEVYDKILDENETEIIDEIEMGIEEEL